MLDARLPQQAPWPCTLLGGDRLALLWAAQRQGRELWKTLVAR